jgi:hypothetical protein
MTEDLDSHEVLPRLLFIVSTRRSDLYAKLTIALAGEPNVEVYLDRRLGQRRSIAIGAPTDRRRSERRQREAIDAEIRDRGWAVVKVSSDRKGAPRWTDIIKA